MTGMIQTVLGPVDPETVGLVLIHEHLFIDYGELLGEPKQVPEQGSTLENQIINGVRALAAAGGELLVDATPLGYGRYPDLMATVSAMTDVHIVACTGGFTEQWAPIHPIVSALSTDKLADLFVRELREGMGGTRHRAGAIKVATGEGRMSELEAHIFRAAATAHRETGAPIITHTTNGLGPMQVEFLRREEVDLAKVVIGHLGFEPDPQGDIKAILEQGANVALDRIGHHHFFPDTHWIDLIKYVLDLGYEEQLVLSHDAVTELVGPEEMREHTFSNYAYLPTTFLPALEEAGVERQIIDRLMRDNPRRILAYEARGGAS